MDSKPENQHKTPSEIIPRRLLCACFGFFALIIVAISIPDWFIQTDLHDRIMKAVLGSNYKSLLDQKIGAMKAILRAQGGLI